MGSGKAGKTSVQKTRSGSVLIPISMEVDGGTTPPTDQINPKYSVNVLQLLKTAQAQHGLRHSDYTRYRRYCSARLRRLYKSLKFTHGRGKYTRKAITDSTVTDVRFLHVVLYMAERAWSYAMEKKQVPDGPNSRQRLYLIGRLKKAVKWADNFAHLCMAKGDSRTSLEAMAYASFMRGSFLLEREKSWEAALTNFKNARAVYDELGKYGDVENQVLCRQRVEEMDPNIRYCLYKMGKSNIQGSELLDLSTQEGPAMDLLRDKLEDVMIEARTQQATSVTDFHWLGRKFPIKNAKTRVSILKAQALEKDLYSSAASSLTTEKQLAVFDKIFSAYHDARRYVRDDLATAGNTEDVKVDLAGLDKAIGCVLVQRTMERNQLLVTIAKSKLSRQYQGLHEDNGEKITKPEELVRLFDIIIQNVTDLSDLATSGRERNAEEETFAEELAVKSLGFRAERCFYLAKSYSLAGKHTEAYALFSRTHEHVESALQGYHRLKNPNNSAMQELKELSDHCRAQRCLEHAMEISEAGKIQDNISKGVSGISLANAENRASQQYLYERLDVYESAVGAPDSKESPHIEKFPPSFQAVPCKPIVLDTAVNAIEFPSLENHLKREDKKGLFGRWWR